MPFAEQFLGRAEATGFTKDQLERFLANGMEESLNLDYKHVAALSAPRPDSVIRTVSAFANAEGGLLILGVDERVERNEKGGTLRIRPGAITWGAKSLLREAVELKIATQIKPPVAGLRIHPIRDPQGQAVFLVDVPQSVRPPHQAADGKYYLRHNFQNLVMEHYQVQALFNRRLRPLLHPEVRLRRAKEKPAEIDVTFGVTNSGAALAKHPMLMAYFYECVSVVSEGGGMFSHVRADEVSPGTFIFVHRSPIEAIHPGIVNYMGPVRVSFKENLTLKVIVGAEDMPTQSFFTTATRDFITRSLESPDPEELRLALMSPDETSYGEAWAAILGQIGLTAADWERLAEAMRSTDPGTMLKVLEEIGRTQRSTT